MNCKDSNDVLAETIVVICNKEFIEVTIEKFKKHALSNKIEYDMITEDCKIFDSHHSTEISFVFFSDLGQNSDLKKCLLDKILTSFGYLEGKKFFIFVIKNL